VRKLWIWIGLVVIGIAAALFFGRSRVETGTVNRPWPLSLGLVADAPKRFPVTTNNAGAAKLIELARKAGVDLERDPDRYEPVDRGTRLAFTDYLRAQLERSTDAIDAPPSDVTRYLTDHAAVLDEIKELALAGDPIVFASDINKAERESPGPHLLGLQHLHRVYVVRALIAARDKNAEAWDELHVAWKLAAPLWNRPESISVMTASTAARFINTAARKLPMPPAPWFQEVLSFQYERALAAAHQAEAWRAKTAAHNVRVRGMAEEVLRARACDAESDQFEAVRKKLGGRATPSLVEAWERMMRFRAERELTQKVFVMRSGQKPPNTTQCSDGTWDVTTDSIKFSRDVGVPEPQVKYALEYSGK
jgi:hypothetical protein